MSWSFLTGFRGYRLEKLRRTSEGLSRRLIIVLKLGILLGTSVAVAYGDRKVWDGVNGNPDLQTWPYNEHGNIGRAFWWGSLSATTISAWTLTSFAIIFITRNQHDRWLHAWGTVDLALACFACYTLNLQAPHVPYRLEQCKGTRPENWKIVDGYPSIFQKLASVEGKSTSAKDICKNFVSLWVAGVTCIFFQFLAAYIGIFSDSNPYSIVNPWRPLYCLVWLFVCPVVLFQYHVIPLTRLGISRLQKYANYIRGWRNGESVELVSYTPPRHPFNNPESKLIDILLMEHLLLKIVGNLHHNDLVNLASTCRSAREAIFPRYDLTMRIPKLRQACCSDSTREACYFCNKIICEHCNRWAWTANPRQQISSGDLHTTNCAPFCRKCYYVSFSRHQRPYKPPCPGHVKTSHKTCVSCFEDNNNSPALFDKRQERFVQDAVAIAHGKLSTKREAGNEAEDKHELHKKRFTYAGNVKRALPIDGRRCGWCGEELKSGMRWWVCGVCRGECKHPIHPPLVRRRDMWNADVEKRGDGESLWARKMVPWWRRLFRE